MAFSLNFDDKQVVGCYDINASDSIEIVQLIKDRNFVNSELSFQFQLKDPPKYVISAQVRNKRLSQPNGTVQIECTNKSKPAAKLGGVPASFLEKYLESIGASKPISIAKNPNIPREFPGNWTESQLSYWINLLQSLQGAAIGLSLIHI